MDLPLLIIRFLHSIRYRVLILSTAVMLLVAYFTQFMPKKYAVFTSIFTGIASQRGLGENSSASYYELSNTFDNIINLTKSKGTLESVSIRLLATNLVYGSETTDNLYITAKHYQELLEIVPQEVLELVDRESLENTISNLMEYKENEPGNFIYELFSYKHPHYSYESLRLIDVKRIYSSDLIEIHYVADDPGIATNTVKYLHEELSDKYNDMRYQSINEVIGYYESELGVLERRLYESEEDLTQYNIDNKVTNYTEQTKELAFSLGEFNTRYELALVRLESSKSTVEDLEKKMSIRSDLYNTNANFISALEEVSSINEKLTKIGLQSQTGGNDSVTTAQTKEYKKKLRLAEEKVGLISNNINNSVQTKEGISSENVVNEWLAETIIYTKARVELDVLSERKGYYDSLQVFFSPIGTNISRKERNIDLIERSYLNALDNLRQARQRVNNIKITSSSFTTVTPASFPLRGDSKRGLYILFSFFATALLVIGIYAFIELIDRTLQNPIRAQKLTKLSIVGAFVSIKQSHHRGYVKACNRKAARALCNSLSFHIEKGSTCYINLLSINKNEGKEYIAKYMKEAWEKRGISVETLLYNKDFVCGANYLKASSLKDFYGTTNADVVIVICPPMELLTAPQALLNEAHSNLMIVNANRAWRTSDDSYVEQLRNIMTQELKLVLNDAKRNYVEDVIGLLPPLASNDTNADKLIQLGVTSSRSQL